jgi:hypothetical protein
MTYCRSTSGFPPLSNLPSTPDEGYQWAAQLQPPHMAVSFQGLSATCAYIDHIMIFSLFVCPIYTSRELGEYMD